MAFELKIASASVVVVGDFVPTVFQPAWLKEQNLIAKAEADAATVEVIHRELTVISTEWLQLNVRPDRFVATCVRGESLPLLIDFALGVFQIFASKRATGLGLNRDEHFEAANEEEWHSLGHKLAPKEPWKGLLETPGMLTVQMQGRRNDALSGKINVIVQPSTKIQFGAFVQVNDHYNLLKDEEPGCVGDAAAIIKGNWKQSFANSGTIASKIIRV